jgi:hypothetical protein
MRVLISGLFQVVVTIGFVLGLGTLAGYSWALSHHGWAAAWAVIGFLVGMVAWILTPPAVAGRPGGATLEVLRSDEDERRFIEKFK